MAIGLDSNGNRVMNTNKELLKNCVNATKFEDLPESISESLQNEKSFANFLLIHSFFGYQINSQIMVDRCIELNSPICASILLANQKYLPSLVKNPQLLFKLVTHFNKTPHLQWLHFLSIFLSSHQLKKHYPENGFDFAVAIEKLRSNNKKPIAENNALINNLFKRANTFAGQNIIYLILNFKACSKLLSENTVKDIFQIASEREIVTLCFAFLKHKPSLLEKFFKDCDAEMRKRILASLIKSEPNGTIFLCSKSSVTQKLFGNSYELLHHFLLHSNKPNKILHAFKKLIKNDSHSIQAVKKHINNVQALRLLLIQNASPETRSAHFHYLLQYKKHILKEYLKNYPFSAVYKADISTSKNEWLVLNLKNNPSLIQLICKKDPNEFLNILKLTSNPGEFLRKFAGKIPRKDRERIIFKSLLYIAKYTQKNPHYQAEFDKTLKEKFWIGFKYSSVKATVVNFLSNEILNSKTQSWLNTEQKNKDLPLLLSDKNLQILFDPSKSLLRRLLKSSLSIRTHKEIAKNYYNRLELECAKPKYLAKIRAKSIYYSLYSLKNNSKERILNEALFGEFDFHPVENVTKEFISKNPNDYFKHPLTILKSLDKSEINEFYQYYLLQIEKINSMDNLALLQHRFEGDFTAQNLISPIIKRREFLIAEQLKVLQLSKADGLIHSQPDGLEPSFLQDNSTPVFAAPPAAPPPPPPSQNKSSNLKPLTINYNNPSNGKPLNTVPNLIDSETLMDRIKKLNPINNNERDPAKVAPKQNIAIASMGQIAARSAHERQKKTQAQTEETWNKLIYDQTGLTKTGEIFKDITQGDIRSIADEIKSDVVSIIKQNGIIGFDEKKFFNLILKKNFVVQLFDNNHVLLKKLATEILQFCQNNSHLLNAPNNSSVNDTNYQIRIILNKSNLITLLNLKDEEINSFKSQFSEIYHLNNVTVKELKEKLSNLFDKFNKNTALNLTEQVNQISKQLYEKNSKLATQSIFAVINGKRTSDFSVFRV